MVELPSRSIVFNSRNGYLKSVVNGDRNSLNTSISAEKDREQRLKCLFPYLPPPLLPPSPPSPTPYFLWDQGKMSLGKGSVFRGKLVFTSHTSFTWTRVTSQKPRPEGKPLCPLKKKKIKHYITAAMASFGMSITSNTLNLPKMSQNITWQNFVLHLF